MGYNDSNRGGVYLSDGIFRRFCDYPSLPLCGWDKIAAEDIFKHIFLIENVWILIEILLKFVPTGRINDIPSQNWFR